MEEKCGEAMVGNRREGDQRTPSSNSSWTTEGKGEGEGGRPSHADPVALFALLAETWSDSPSPGLPARLCEYCEFCDRARGFTS